MKEKRKSIREKTLWKVNIVEDNNESFIGYLMDISEGGAKFYIDKQKAGNLNKDFKVKISPPYEVNLENLILDVEKVWQRESHFIEMGVKFCNTESIYVDFIQQLLVIFNKDKKLTVETEIIP